jgi:hypothetical protein
VCVCVHMGQSGEDSDTCVGAHSEKGDVMDGAYFLQEIVDKCAAENSVPIVHCVQGSKTGIFEPYPATNFGKMVRGSFLILGMSEIADLSSLRVVAGIDPRRVCGC